MIISIVVTLIILGIFAFNINNKKSNPDSKSPNNIIIPKLERKYYDENNCVNPNDSNCIEKKSKYYRIDDYNKNPDLSSIIDDINNTNINRLENLRNSKPSFEGCSEMANIYKYRYVENFQVHFYVNDSVSVIAQDLVSKDVCSGKVINPIFVSYYYDIKKQRMLDENEFLRKLNISKNSIDDKIINYLIDNKILRDKSSYSNFITNNKINCHVYLSMVGNMLARCIYEDETFYDISLFKKFEIGL